VTLAIRTGVAADHWIEDPRAAMTAVQLIAEADRRRR